MKQKKWITVGLVAGCVFVVILLFTDSTPDYGVKSRWKKLVLKNLLSDEVPKISVAEAQAKKTGVLFLDTREAAEYHISHIRGAVFAGYKNFDLTLLQDVPKHQPIITYCSIGKRSDEIAQKLIAAGYRQVQNLYGGIFEWVNKGYTIVDDNDKPTARVHAFSSLWARWLERGEKVY